MPHNKRFTTDEIEFIKSNADKMTVSELAQHLGRTEKGVRTKIERLGIRLGEFERNQPYQWTDEDVAVLRANYQRLSDEELVNRYFPNLSIGIVFRKRKDLGLDKQDNLPFLQSGYYCIARDGKKYWVHKLEAEKKIGRKLKSWERVHHINGDKLDNRHENLYVCDKRKHGLVHDSIEKVAFELVKSGLIGFDEARGEYFLKPLIRTEG